jgi:hypothetical protein
MAHRRRYALDANIATPNSKGATSPIGIEFAQDGNYYGDNRIAALLPFSLGGTIQTDWGGNASY